MQHLDRVRVTPLPAVWDRTARSCRPWSLAQEPFRTSCGSRTWAWLSALTGQRSVLLMWLFELLVLEFSSCLTFSPLQDVLVVSCSKDFMASNHVLATCRTALKKQGIVGLNIAPCMRAFLERLPIMLQEQYVYEKVQTGFRSTAADGNVSQLV